MSSELAHDPRKSMAFDVLIIVGGDLRGLSKKELEALSSEVDNRCNDNRTAILIEGCLKK